jgi:hypothetical protein
LIALEAGDSADRALREQPIRTRRELALVDHARPARIRSDDLHGSLRVQLVLGRGFDSQLADRYVQRLWLGAGEAEPRAAQCSRRPPDREVGRMNATVRELHRRERAAVGPRGPRDLVKERDAYVELHRGALAVTERVERVTPRRELLLAGEPWRARRVLHAGVVVTVQAPRPAFADQLRVEARLQHDLCRAIDLQRRERIRSPLGMPRLVAARLRSARARSRGNTIEREDDRLRAARGREVHDRSRAWCGWFTSNRAGCTCRGRLHARRANRDQEGEISEHGHQI